MSARVVCDASALVALLLDSGSDGQWVTDTIAGSDLAAPSLVEFESANIFRRHELAGIVSADQAAQAHAERGSAGISWRATRLNLKTPHQSVA